MQHGRVVSTGFLELGENPSIMIVRLSKAKRAELREVIKKLKGTNQKAWRAQILLKTDADEPNQIYCAHLP